MITIIIVTAIIEVMLYASYRASRAPSLRGAKRAELDGSHREPYAVPRQLAAVAEHRHNGASRT